MTTDVLPTFARDLTARLIHTPEAGWVQQTRKDGTLYIAAKNYRVTSPTDIAEKLVAKGFTVGRCLSLFSHGRFEGRADRRASPWRYGLEVGYPGAPLMNDERDLSPYASRARILLANDGRTALRIALGALRLACTNQFTSCVISVRHTNRDIDDFIADPASWLNAVRYRADATGPMVARLQGIPVPMEYSMALRPFTRLRSTMIRERSRYWHAEDPSGLRSESFWAFSQALTASRSPRLLKASMAILQDGDLLAAGGRSEAYFACLKN